MLLKTFYFFLLSYFSNTIYPKPLEFTAMCSKLASSSSSVASQKPFLRLEESTDAFFDFSYFAQLVGEGKLDNKENYLFASTRLLDDQSATSENIFWKQYTDTLLDFSYSGKLVVEGKLDMAENFLSAFTGLLDYENATSENLLEY
ncbi:hypothetical protein M9H77_08303 [Catharanthus roseus]|uniref:Uncharacterized protein n=1 Tax=Catharanthus roseus TaxID=4058 RepID=A0ACC0BXS9_CATRO|nr:hypothetical protein M9H77_08303 [Catharanthus roseus]